MPGELTFMFPAWNEELIIERTIAAALITGQELVASGRIDGFEVLIVDDASTDATGALVDAIAAVDDRVRVVHHSVNRKLGGAIRTGLSKARGDLVLYSDADMPFDLDQLHKALRLADIYDADVVSAYRHDRTGEGARRALYSHVYNAAVRGLLQLRVRDVNFAFKLIRRRVIDHLELRSEGSFIDVELLAKAQRMGFHIIQFGVDYFPRARGTSTLSSPAVIAKILRELVALYGDVLRTRPVASLPPRG
ncbi:MAG: glycosyltransferase family 2 protein [Acidimicrobiia bacterium]